LRGREKFFRQDKVALPRGSLVYCLESKDNPGIDIFNDRIDLTSIYAEPSPILLGGIWALRGNLDEWKRIHSDFLSLVGQPRRVANGGLDTSMIIFEKGS
jgi:hypothetical protein